MKKHKKILNKLRGEINLRKLQKRGLKIGKNINIMEGCIIDPSHCWHIEIGDDVILAPRVHILAHDASTQLSLNHTKVANVKIGNRVFLGAGTIVLPGVTIGDDVVVGAGSIVKRDIPENSLALGVPAKVIMSLNAYVEKEKGQMRLDNVFNEEYTLRNPNFSEKHRTELLDSTLKNKTIYVE